ncbi:ABC transporter ATP-binding protein [Anaerosporobacter sp.]
MLEDIRLEIKDVSSQYGDHSVLKKVSFRAKSGQLICLLGPNGVGKSTLFRCILRLQHYSGIIRIDGVDNNKLTPKMRARKISYIPQNHIPTYNYKVKDIVLMGTSSGLDAFSLPGKLENDRVDSALEKMGIIHLKDRGYANISGGERQLVLIARALAQDTQIMIMDEPTSNLDYGNQNRVLQKIKELEGEGFAIIMSMHNPEQAFLYASKVMALENGELIGYGDTDELLDEEMLSKLYQLNVKIFTVGDNNTKVCIPYSFCP